MKYVIQGTTANTAAGYFRAAAGATITIRDATTGAIISLWADRDGVVSKANPFTADADGYFIAYADAGYVDITAASSSGTDTWSDVPVGPVGGGGGLTYFAESKNTTAPNATVPVEAFSAAGAEADIDAAMVPKGNGGFSLAIPDGTSVGGNKRGIQAIDLQTYRDTQSQVASGDWSTIGGGWDNTASGSESTVCGGGTNTASGALATVGGGSGNTASGLYSCVSGGVGNVAAGADACVSGGGGNAANGAYSFVGGGSSVAAGGDFSAVVGGNSGVAGGAYSAVISGLGGTDRGTAGSVVHNSYGADGASQASGVGLRGYPSGAAPTVLSADAGVAAATNQITLPPNSAYTFDGIIVARRSAAQGTDTAAWAVSGLIRQEGSAATTTLVASTVTPISNVPGYVLAISADTTLGALAFTFTGAVGHTVNVTANIRTVQAVQA